MPDLEEKYRVLLDPCSRLLSQSGEMSNVLKSQARRDLRKKSRAEVKVGTPYRWRSFLCWLPALLSFFENNPNWKTGWPTASKLATAFLAFDFETGAWVVTAALSADTEPISEDAVRLLVRAAMQGIKAKPGGNFGEDFRTPTEEARWGICEAGMGQGGDGALHRPRDQGHGSDEPQEGAS